jgi:hypothetical protein
MLGTFVGGTAYVDPASRKPAYCFDVVDLDRGEVKRIPLDFLAHGFSVNPRAPHQVVVFEKRGPGAAVLDLLAMKLVGNVRCKKARAYYGHGVYTPDGEHLLVVESDLATGEGVVSVRETTTYKEIDTFPTFGARPHDCVPIEGGRVLVFTNGGLAPADEAGGGGVPSVTYVETASRTLLERVPMSTPELNAGHAAIARDGTLVVVSAPRDGLPPETSAGGIHVRAPGAAAERLRAPSAIDARIVGESLSVRIHDERGVFAVSNPSGDLVTFWSLSTRALVGSFDLAGPRGLEITGDARSFVVAGSRQGGVTLVDVETLRPRASGVEAPCLSGSHIYRYELPAR